MAAIKLKNNIAQEHKNRRGGSSVDYDREYENIYLKARELIKSAKNNVKIIENKKILVLEYKNIPPKTTRIEFRKIKNFEEIPQIDMVTKYENKLHTSEITYLLTDDEFNKFIKHLEVIECLGKITEDIFNNLKPRNLQEFIKKISKILSIKKRTIPEKITNSSYVKILPIYSEYVIKSILDQLKIRVEDMDWGTYFIILNPEQYGNFYDSHDYLIAEVQSNSKHYLEEIDLEKIDDSIALDKPSNVTVGVIDSGIELPEMFKDYYEYEDHREFGIYSDTNHGSAVSSLVIANDKLNPGDEDNFGQFKVKHFELFEFNNVQDTIFANSLHLYRKINEIVTNNQQIKIWNLSFGEEKRFSSLNISYLGKLLDSLSKKFDCLFIVSSGNATSLTSDSKKIFKTVASPADALNALSVGSVRNDKNTVVKSAYSSKGPVAHFEKPEIAHFGGPYNMDNSNLRTYCGSKITALNSGTSFSAPKIARFAANLLSKNYNCQQIKANIIAMSKRETKTKKSSTFGSISFADNQHYHSLNGEVILYNNNPQYIDFVIPEATEKISISLSFLATSIPIMGEEYNLSDVRLSLIRYKKEILEPEQTAESKITIKSIAKTQFEEINRRFEAGKYFTSKKNDYLRKQIDIGKQKYETMALRLRKMDLYNTTENISLNVAFCIKIIGDISERDVIACNESIVEIETEVEAEATA